MFQAGSVEGQVVEMGLTTTSLLTAEKFPVLVPNSLFSSQVDIFINLPPPDIASYIFWFSLLTFLYFFFFFLPY
jgi:hypothetical protein